VEDIVSGQVTNKRAVKVSPGWGAGYYVTIGTKEFLAPAKIYNSLSIGNYITASYKKNWGLYQDMLVKILNT
jgi:hypothetical protein